MNYDLRLRPELVEDAHDAFIWYEAAAVGLGNEFLRSYFAAISAAQRDPLLRRRIYRSFRRVLLRRFPYALYYQIEDTTVVVFLLIHGARDSSSVQRALRVRKNTPTPSNL